MKFDILVNILKYSAELSIPRKASENKNKHKCMTRWNDIMKPFKEKSIFCTSLWKDAGCPNNTDLDECRTYARIQYHKAIKFIKQNEKKLISNNISSKL